MKFKQAKLFESEIKEISGPYDLPDGWKWVKLGDIAIVNPSKKELSTLPDDIDVSFIPMAYIDDISGSIIKQDKKKLKEVRQGYTYFKEGDILFAKITPCMENGKCAVAKHLVNGIGFGSTEFHVIRPNKDELLSEYIHHYLRQEWIRKEATKYFTGSVGQQRVPDSFLKKLPIPLPFKNGKPDIEEQKRIASRIEELFSRIDRIKELRKQAKEEAEVLLKAALHQVFSKTDEKGWRWVKLGNICKIFSGSSAPQGEKYFKDGKFPFVRVQDLGRYGRTSNLVNIKDKVNELAIQTFKLIKAKKGTILLPKSGAAVLTNNRAILGTDAFIVSHLAAIEPLKDFVSSKFIYYWISQVDMGKYIENLAYPSLKISTLKKLRIPLPFKNGKPDLEEQKRITDYLDRIAEKQKKLLELYEKTEKELELMKQSILNKAFRGQL